MSSTSTDESFLASRLKSFACAFAGLRVVVTSQHNAWIHAAITLAVLLLGAALEIGRLDWCWLIVAIAMVWVAECLNTALEALADATAPDPHPLVGRAKDSAAAGVLVAAVGAAAIGLLVLGRALLLRIASG